MNKKLQNELMRNMAAAKSLNRRDFIYSMGASLGSIALASMLPPELSGAATKAPGPLTVKDPHLPPKAKNVIFLMMEGGPSHIDTFDPKPELSNIHLQKFTRGGENKSAMESGTRYYVQGQKKGVSS